MIEAQDRPDDHDAVAPWSYETEVKVPIAATEARDLGEGAAAPSDRESSGSEEKPADARREAKPREEDAGGGQKIGQEEPGRDTNDKDQRDESKADKAEDGGKDEPPPPPPSKWVFIVAGLVLAGLLAWGAYAHWRSNQNASSTQQAVADRTPEVRTVQAERDDKPLDLTLPGQTEAIETASLYARATGYITERRADIGSRVKKGDLLLHIAAPDLDQQLAQAEAQVGQVKAAEAQAAAQVNQAEANVNLAKVTLARTSTLTQQGYDTLQNRDNQTAALLAQQANLDTATAGVKVAEANTKAQLATVDRLKALAAFEDIVAPFDGVVTVRNVDVGDLVNADSASATPLFSLARDAVIRVTVQVPQNAATGVRNGLPAKIAISQMPGTFFRGTITRSSVALLTSARTLDTEVDIPNPDGRLRPGLFAYVTIDIPRDHANVVVPAEALIFNQHGLQVATVTDDKVALRSVVVDRDLGTTVELKEGLEGGEQVVLSPPALLESGQKVKVKAPDKPAEGGPGGEGSAGGDKPKDGASGQKPKQG